MDNTDVFPDKYSVPSLMKTDTDRSYEPGEKGFSDKTSPCDLIRT